MRKVDYYDEFEFILAVSMYSLVHLVHISVYVLAALLIVSKG